MKTPRTFLLGCVCMVMSLSQGLIAQKDCDTFLGTITDPDNDCAPCTNGMAQLMQPFLQNKNANDLLNAMNTALDTYLDQKQQRIDDLMVKQKQTDRVLKEWGIGDLNGGPAITDPAYLQNTIDDMKAYAKRFPEESGWFQTWIEQFEQLIAMIKECTALHDSADALADRIRNHDYGDLLADRL